MGMSKGEIRDEGGKFYKERGERPRRGARISLPHRACSRPHYMNVEMFSLNGRVILDYIDVKFYHWGKIRRFRPVVMLPGEDCGNGALVQMKEIQTDSDFFAQEERDKR